MYRKLFALLLFVVLLLPFAAPSRGDIAYPSQFWFEPYADEKRSIGLKFSSLSASLGFISSKNTVNFELYVSGPCKYEYKIISKDSNKIIKSSSNEKVTFGPEKIQIFCIDTKNLKKRSFKYRIHGKIIYYNYKKTENKRVVQIEKTDPLHFSYDVVVDKIKYDALPSITVNGQKVKIERGVY